MKITYIYNRISNDSDSRAYLTKSECTRVNSYLTFQLKMHLPLSNLYSYIHGVREVDDISWIWLFQKIQNCLTNLFSIKFPNNPVYNDVYMASVSIVNILCSAYIKYRLCII